jgi:hypothetical protein
MISAFEDEKPGAGFREKNPEDSRNERLDSRALTAFAS